MSPRILICLVGLRGDLEKSGASVDAMLLDGLNAKSAPGLCLRCGFMENNTELQRKRNLNKCPIHVACDASSHGRPPFVNKLNLKWP